MPASSPNDDRSRILRAALDLLRETGFYQFELATLAERAGVPLEMVGSLFPQGKVEIVCEAMKFWAPDHLAGLAALLENAPDTPSALEATFDYGCKALRASNFVNICPIAILALENALTAPQIQGTCSTGIDLLANIFRKRLAADRIPPEKLADLSLLITTVFEGCFVSSRAYNDATVMAVVGRQLADLLRSYINDLG